MRFCASICARVRVFQLLVNELHPRREPYLVLVRVLEVVDELHDLDLGLVQPGHVLEGDAAPRLHAQLVHAHEARLPDRPLEGNEGLNMERATRVKRRSGLQGVKYSQWVDFLPQPVRNRKCRLVPRP